MALWVGRYSSQKFTFLETCPLFLDRRQYNEAYVYSAGEVVTKNRVHGFPDSKEKSKILVETVESPMFPRILTVNDYANRVRRRESAYI